MKPLSMAEYLEESEQYSGYCTHCKDITRGECEPDARDYECPECGNHTVYGIEEAMMQGILEVEE